MNAARMLPALVAALLMAACASDPASGPAAGGAAKGSAPAASSGGPALGGALNGVVVGGINLGAAANAVQSASEATRDISEPEEIEMGRNVASSLLGVAPLVKNAAQQRYVNELGRWLALHSGRPDLPWKFGIVEADTVNAFATPGGVIFVSRGLVQRTRSESELAGVLAHEIAHVVQKHHLADIKKNASKNLLVDLASVKAGTGLGGEAAKAVARVGLEGFVRGLSREDELEADRLGVTIATRAGYEPYGLVAVLQTLASLPQNDAALGQFLRTHPKPSERLTLLEAEIPASYERYAQPNPALARYNTVFRSAAGSSAASPAKPASSAAPAKPAAGAAPASSSNKSK